MADEGYSDISGRLADLRARRIVPATIRVRNGLVDKIRIDSGPGGKGFLLPGFIDAHVHLESAMLAPSEFARAAVLHGTTATVSDPHEIANVLGAPGVRYMVQDGRSVPFHFFFGAPSCVPATVFDGLASMEDPPRTIAIVTSKFPSIHFLSLGAREVATFAAARSTMP